MSGLSKLWSRIKSPKRSVLVVFFVALAAVLAGWFAPHLPDNAPLRQLHVFFMTHALPTATIGVGDRSMLVELAFEPKTRSQGLMFRDSLHRNEGMLFIYPKSEPRSFWMKNTRVPLSIAFADSQGVIVFMADMQPLSTQHTASDKPAKYALEVAQGWFKANNVKVGDKLTNLPNVKVR